MSQVYGTKVTNPARRVGQNGYSMCVYCKLLFTTLGISRHWGKCKARKALGEICAGKAAAPQGELSAVWCYKCGEGTTQGLCRLEAKKRGANEIKRT